jgi:AraC-like DNA-binding protein
VLTSVVRELDPAVDERPDLPFPFVTGPCDSRTFWRNLELTQRIARGRSEPFDPLWADVTALQLVADVLEAAFARRVVPRKRRRVVTEADHADRAEAVKTYLAAHMHERVTLSDVARAAHTSPFHLARIFQQYTGIPVHHYLTRLRLRSSLERLACGTPNLAALALELGFSSHSHFTDTFRREFGCAPSAIRKSVSPRGVSEMSKNLEV